MRRRRFRHSALENSSRNPSAMPTSTSSRRRWRGRVALIAALSMTGTAWGQTTVSWDGGTAGTNTSWSTAGNWVGDVLPATGDSVLFNSRSGTGTIPDLSLGANFSLATLTFDNVNSRLPTTLNIDTNGSGTTGRSLTISAGVTLTNYSGTINFRGSNGTLTASLTGAQTTMNVGGSSTLAFAVPLGGAGGLSKTGTGTLSLATSGSYTGKTIITGGTVRGSGESIFGANPASFTADQITLNGGTFQASGAVDFNSNRGITLGASGGTINSNGNAVTLTNVVTGGGTLTKIGAGTLSLNNAHTYTGGTAINGGTVALTVANAIGTTGAITFGGGTLQFSAANTTDYSARFTGATSQAYSFDTNGQSVSFANPLTATTGSSLAKLGTGTLTLSGTQTYSGVTTVAAGTLQMGATAALPATTAVTVGTSGGTTGAVSLNVNGTSQTVASLVLLGGGTSAANSGGVNLGSGGTLTVNGAISYETGANNRYPSQITGTGASTLNLGGATRTITVWDNSNSGYDLQIAVPIDNGGVNFVGSGGAPILSLSASNTFTGGVTIGNGVLQLGNAGALNSTTPNAVAFASGSTGVLRLNGNSVTVAGLSTNATPGTPVVENAVASNTSTLTVNLASGTNTFAGVLQNGAGTLALTKSGVGTLVLTGSNTYTGATTISAGTLQIGNGGTTGSLAITTAIANSATLSINRSGTSTLANVISGPGVVRHIGTGATDLAVTNSYTGPTIIENGTLVASTLADGGKNSPIGASSNAAANLVLAGGILRYNGSAVANIDRSYTFGSASAAVGGGFEASGTNTLTISGSMTAVNAAAGVQTFSIGGTNTGANTLSGNIVDSSSTALTAVSKSGAGTWVLSGNNTFTGGVTLSDSGVLRVGSAGALNSTTPNAVTFGASSTADLQLNGNSITVAGLNTNATPGTPTVENASATPATLTISGSGSSTYGGVLQNGTGGGALTLVKSGAGTQTLSGANTHTGGTSVTAGTLTVGNANALGPNNTTVSTSGTGQINLNGTNVTVGGLSSTNSGGSGSITSSTAATLTVNAASPSTYGGTIGGSVTLAKTGSSTLTLSGSNTHAGTTVNAGTVVAAASSALGASGAQVSVAGGATLFAAAGTTIDNPITLGTTSSTIAVTQNFDALGSGLPSGWTVYSGATSTSLGTNVSGSAFSSAATAWTAASSAGYYNVASATVGSGAVAAAQNAASDRALGLRPAGGSPYDPGAAIVYSFNTTGNTVASLGLTLQLLDPQTRSNTATVQYSLNGGTTWVSFTGGTYADPGAFASSTLVLNNATEIAAISNQSSVLVRVALLTASTGTGSRDLIGLDNFTVNYVQAGSGATLGTDATSAVTEFSRSVTLQNAGTFTSGSGSVVTMSSAIGESGGSFGLTKTGLGTVVLSATNTYTGATTVSAGTLRVNGSIASSSGLTVAAGATLGGSGTAPATSISGTLAPGNSPGVLNTGNLTLNNNSTYAVELTGSGTTAGTHYDQANVTGTVTIGTINTDRVTLSLLPSSYTHTGGNQFVIVNNDASDAVTATGKFKSGTTDLNEGTQFLDGGNAFRLSYAGGTGNDVVLTALNKGTLSLTAGAAGRAIVGQSGTVGLTLSNSGTTANTATVGYTLTGATGGPGSLAGGASTGAISATITPSQVGPNTASVSASADAFGINASSVTVTVNGLDNRVITPAAVAFDRVMVNQAVGGSSSLTSAAANSVATTVTVNGTAVAANADGIGVSAGSATTFDGTVTTGSRSLAGTFTATGAKSGSTANLSITGEGLSGEVVNAVAIPYTATVVANRDLSSPTTLSFGRVMVNADTGTQNVSISGGSADDNNATRVNIATAQSLTNSNVTFTTSGATSYNGANISNAAGTIVAKGNWNSTGAKSGNANAAGLLSNGETSITGTVTVDGSVPVAYTATVVDNRTFDAVPTVNLGNVFAGATTGSQSVTIQSTQSSDVATTATLQSASQTDGVVTLAAGGSAVVYDGSTTTTSRGLAGTFSIASTSSVTGTLNVLLDNESLAGAAATRTVPINYTANVFSHSNSSFDSASDLNSIDLTFYNDPNAPIDFSQAIYNLAGVNVADAVHASSVSSELQITPGSMSIAGGASSLYGFTWTPTAYGSSAYTLTFNDQAGIAGGSSTGLTLNLTLQPVPEPAVICGSLLIAANLLRRKRVSI
jgi:autotransporter-associated beta strand protein